MIDYETLNHTKWECKYHVVFIPKYRRKALYKELRKHLGELFRELATRRECKVEEGHLTRARSTSHERTEDADEISLARTSGRAASSSRPWVGTKKWCESTSVTRRRRTDDLSS